MEVQMIQRAEKMCPPSREARTRHERSPRGPRMARRCRRVLAAALVTLGLPAPAASMQDLRSAEREAGLSDARWAAFVGCWEPVVGEGDADDGVLCVRPSDAGVEMFTIREGEIRTSDLLVADGAERQIRAEGCAGWEAVWFSGDGRRAFTRSSYACDGVTQTGTGVMALVSPTQWVDVRALEVDGERTSWVQRYRLVGRDRATREGVSDAGFRMETASRAARYVGHRGVGLPEVEEAAREVDAEAVEGWLANRDEGFQLTGAELEALADAGVPESVIDVVVAKSFPETFRVEAGGDAERAAAAAPRAGYERAPRPRKAFYFGPRGALGFRMSRYGYGYGYGYVPADAFFYGYVPADAFFYGYGSGYPGYWGYRPGSVIIERRAPEPRGRIERGRGYTRSSGGSGDAAVPRSERSGGEAPAAAPSGGSDGSQSGSQEPERRTARPRTPGGG